MKEIIKIFIAFLKIGSITFGGGYTMLPLLRRDIVHREGWATDEEIIDYYAISQSLPGIVASNTAMLIGYGRHGVPGQIAALLGIIFPSLVIILVIAMFIKNFLELEVVIHAFNGIRVAVSVLILNTTIEMAKKCIVDAACVCVFLAAFSAFAFFDISPIIPVLAAAAAGILLKVMTERRA
jgi:chromate transporter